VYLTSYQEGYSWNPSYLCPCRLLPNDASWLQISKKQINQEDLLSYDSVGKVMWICKISHNFAKTGNRCVSSQPLKFIRCISPTATSTQLLRQFRKPKTEKPLSMIHTDHRVFPISYFFAKIKNNSLKMGYFKAILKLF
jgi:hypothetical protein